MTATERRLVLIRHAKSDWSDGLADVERPLADRGHRDAPAVGRWLRDHVGRIDLVLCSAAVRARQTWELAAAELDPPPRLVVDERLYGAPADDLLAAVRELPAEVASAALVGHNPGLQDLATLLTGKPVELKTAAVAVLGWPGGWPAVGPGTAALDAQAQPRG
jgi:phosphohistidine phosphatase